MMNNNNRGGGGGGGGGRERERERDRDRDRFRREYSEPPLLPLPPRFEERPQPYHPHQHRNNRPPAPPSRHLWVGNLSHHITDETALSEEFLRFGEIDSIHFKPGRSYAFINYRKDEDAIIAVRALQGFLLAGLPLKIEFTKAERLSGPSHDDHHQWQDDRRFVDRGGSLFPRDSRMHHISPEPFYHEKSKMGDKNAEPSEVLWIGFPSFLNVDEMVLGMAFSPFGEIEKITTFPGRSYAFVRFRNLVAACRAKEALQGRLFNNPRVSICFAKSDSGAPEHGRNLTNAPLSPHFNSSGQPGHSIDFPQDRKIGNSTRPPHMGSHFASDFESGDSGAIGLGGKRSSPWTGGSGPILQMRSQGPQSEQISSQNMFEKHNSPTRERGSPRHDFPPGRHPRKGPFFEDPSDLHDNAFLFRETKKLKTGPFPPDNELPEYPFADSAQESGFSRTFIDVPEHEVNDNNYVPGPFGPKRISDHPMNLARPLGDRDDNWTASYDRFEAGSRSLPTNSASSKAFTSEPHQPPLSGEWKWQGTIAKGGSPICRARCFPVGKLMDSILPEFLDCTARTGLDMLAKHFYQAASAWVVFFVPESDADIPLYNEFMHFLGEKQRAAVAKLGEKTTLFLVPPSDFSEKVLKVPGKLSISGVILRFQQPSSDFGSLNQPLEAMDSKPPSYQDDVLYPKPISTDLRSSGWGQSQGYSNLPSEPFVPPTSFASSIKSGLDDLPFSGNMPGTAISAPYNGTAHLTGRVSEPLNESGYYQPMQPRPPAFPPNWAPHHLQNSIPGTGNLFPQMPNNTMLRSEDTIVKEHLGNSRAMQEPSSGHYTPMNSDIPLTGSSNFAHQETKSQVSSSLSIPSLQPEQLAQLASLLGQRQQSGSGPTLPLGKQSNPGNQSGNTFLPSQNAPLQNHALSDFSASQFGQVHQLLQQASNATAVPQTTSAVVQMGPPESQGNQLHNSGTREEEADPQRRLQATLQLAATLLQQIQQQAKAV